MSSMFEDPTSCEPRRPQDILQEEAATHKYERRERRESTERQGRGVKGLDHHRSPAFANLRAWVLRPRVWGLEKMARGKSSPAILAMRVHARFALPSAAPCARRPP